MSRKTAIASLALLALTSACSSATVRADGAAADASTPTAEAAASALTSAEAETLSFMREEEKLARDVYRLSADALPVFANISESEGRHMAAVLTLLDAYGLPDPVASNPEGQFANTDLQALYDTLAARSRSSLTEALRVGAEIEEIDIIDLEEAIAETTHDDVAMVYANLMSASENHLRAFTSQLERRGEPYVAQHLDDARFTEIAEAPMQPGGR